MDSTESKASGLVRLLDEGLGTRRVFGTGLAGLAIAAGLTHLDLDDTVAKKRKKNKKRRKKNRNGDGNGDGGNGGGGGGGGDVDSCGNQCSADQACVDGFCVTAFGQGEFNRPTGISLALSGEEILVVDSGNGRIVQLSGGEPNGGFGEPGNADGQFTEPSGIAVNVGLGRILVVDAAAHRIQQFNVSGEFQKSFGFFGGGAEQINAPRGVAIDQLSDNIYIADTANSRIKLLNGNLFFLRHLGNSTLR